MIDVLQVLEVTTVQHEIKAFKHEHNVVEYFNYIVIVSFADHGPNPCGPEQQESCKSGPGPSQSLNCNTS